MGVRIHLFGLVGRSVKNLLALTCLCVLAGVSASAFAAVPTITSFTPASGVSGAIVTIIGTNFVGASAVKFGGVAATSFTVVTANSIRVTVPKTTTGKVTVTTPGGTAISPAYFYGPPTIISFTPTSGGAGATVTIAGTNLTNVSAVKFNGVAVTSFKVANSVVITAVLSKTTTGKITVTTPGGTATSVANFTFIPAPAITSFTPTSGDAGATVMITGTYLTGSSSVKFNGVGANFRVLSATSITAVVPKTTTGKISVTTPGGTTTSATSFTMVYPIAMIYIPAGYFLMGNSGFGDDQRYSYEIEFPQHSVYVLGYSIGKYEVTRGEYRAFMNAGGGYGAHQTSAVGSYQSGTSPYGCQDMAGNVFEWCKDWFDGPYYSDSPSSDPQGPASGDDRVLRGGNWYGDYYYSGSYSRCAARCCGMSTGTVVGFRLAR